MDISLKFNDTLNIYILLKEILEDENSELEPLFKFRLLGIVKELESHVQNFETIRNDKIREYGEVQEDGSIKIDKDNKDIIKKFEKDISSILNSNVSINISKLKAEQVFRVIKDIDSLVSLYSIIEE